MFLCLLNSLRSGDIFMKLGLVPAIRSMFIFFEVVICVDNSSIFFKHCIEGRYLLGYTGVRLNY
jgi:hypothetical protein